MLTPRIVHQIVLYSSAILSLAGNVVFILVATHKSLRILGSYRVLLVAFACMDMTISLFHAYALPVYVQIGYGSVAFMLDAIHLPAYTCSIVNVVAFCLFYESFPLLTCHFIYRYFAVTRPNFISRNFLAAVISAVTINISFCVTVTWGLWALEANASDHFFDEVLMTEYGIDMRSPSAPPMIYLNYFHSLGGEICWNSFRVLASVLFATSATLIVNTLCTVQIIKQLRHNSTLSLKTKNLQLQLFRTLILQFSIPIVFCFVPFGFIGLAPLTGRRFGATANLLGMLTSVFPSIDPLVVLLIMPKFRQVISGWIREMVSLFSNMLLILTIKSTTTMSTDNYRYLLLCFAVGDMISSLTHSYISPIVHLTEHGFFFFPKHANELKSENATLGKFVCLFYVFTYYETFNILACHFIYRYKVIVQGKLEAWTMNWKLGHWLSIAVVFMTIHSALMVWAMGFSNVTNEYSLSLDSSTFVCLYGVNTSDPTIGYVAVEFRRLNKATGFEEYDEHTLISFAVIMSGFGLSASSMVFCSVYIIEALKSFTVSSARKVQQQMLFRALLIQTLVPCIFSYFPTSIIWLFPLSTGYALGPFGNILIMLSGVFPSIDAIMIILFIPAYKNSVVNFFLKKMKPAEMVVVSSISFTKEPEDQTRVTAVSSNVSL